MIRRVLTFLASLTIVFKTVGGVAEVTPTNSAPAEATAEQDSADLRGIAPPEEQGARMPFRAAALEANDFQLRLETGRSLREVKDYKRAESTLVQLLESRAPEEVKRPALLELAQTMQEQKSYQKAQTLYSEYVRRHANDPSVPEVLMRQGYLYREMGIPVLALSKYYGVISTCLNLKLDDMSYYQQLVLRAQQEIAETYYLQGKFEEAADFYHRLLKLEIPEDRRAEVTYKLTRCYLGMGSHVQVVANARLYLEKYGDAVDAAETRFMLADSLKKLERTAEALQEIFALLKAQDEKSKAAPEQWRYWQQRAGNTIANQLYREGDYFSALQVYEALAELNASAEWQLPVWYQIGLVYENLKQHEKATEMYEKIVLRAKDLAGTAPSIKAIMDMAAWRKQYVSWEASAQQANARMAPPPEEDPEPILN